MLYLEKQNKVNNGPDYTINRPVLYSCIN